ncbi:MAG: hypothetical protein M5U15_00030 [Kiritimatiellae bacterium]|nr:hypothetical protein [Kiritimatiellia bacterium]
MSSGTRGALPAAGAADRRSRLFLFEGQQQFAQVAFDQFLFERGFLGGAFDEAAAVAVA